MGTDSHFPKGPAEKWLSVPICGSETMPRAKPDAKLMQRILREGMKPSEARDTAIRRAIRSIPKGKVATYAQVAAAAGYPLYHRLVVRVLRNCADTLPWQRVLGAGGLIKLRGEAGLEQRMRLQLEGVTFRGRRVDMDRHQHVFRLWEEPAQGEPRGIPGSRWIK